MFSPGMLGKSLTPRLMKSRRRFGTLSVGSASYLLPSTTDSEDCVSPMWEDEQVSFSISFLGMGYGSLLRGQGNAMYHFSTSIAEIYTI